MRLNRTDEASLRQIAQELNDAESSLRSARERLRTLYELASHEQYTAPKPTPVAASAPPPPKEVLPPPAVPKKVASSSSMEGTVIGLVAAAGVILTLLGVSFLVWLAIATGMLGPVGRIVLAWLIAAALFGGAVIVHRRGLAAEGKIALVTASQLTSVLTVMATVSLLHWWSPLFGAIVLLVLLAFFSAVARYWQSEPMLLTIGMTGFGLFCIYILSGDFFSFPILAPALFLAVSSMQRRWFKARTAAAVIGPAGVILGATDMANSVDAFPISLLVVLGVAAFVTVALLDEWEHESDLQLGCYSPLAMLLLGGVLSESFVELTILIAVIVCFAILSVQFHGLQAVGPLTLLPMVYLFWWSKAPAMETGHIIERPWLVAGYFLVFSGFAWWLARNNRYRWHPWASMFVVAMIISWDLGRSMLFKKPLWLTDHIAAVQILTVLVFMATIVLLHRALADFDLRSLIVIGIGGLHLSAIVIVGLSTYLYGLFDHMWFGFYIGHAAVSILWMILGAYILLVDRRLSDQASLIVGMVLTIAAMVKLLFYDLSTLDGLMRVFTFILAGAVMLTIASLRAKRTKQLQ